MKTIKSHVEAITFIAGMESNARTYAKTFDRMLERGSLSTIWDIDGKEYIDLLACAGALPLGHNHPYVMEQVDAFIQSGQILQCLDIATPAKLKFIEQLVLTLPQSFSANVRIQFCGPTGSDAVEAALKLFKISTGRRSVIAFHGAYHGMTLGALSLMGNIGPKTAITGLAAETHFFPYPNSNRCPFGVGGIDGENLSLRYLDNVLSDPESGITKPAMIILEAIQGEGGCIPASVNWLQQIREITLRHDIPLVIDEVQTGFGRTGEMFAYEESGITPDAIILSKALGGGFPLSVLAYHKKYDKWNSGAHAGTFRGNQIAFIAGAATLEYIRENNLPSQVKRKGDYLKSKLRELSRELPCLGEIRGKGLMVGAEIVVCNGDGPQEKKALDGVLAKAIKRECFVRGVIVETGGRHGAVLRFLPALTITENELDAAMLVLKAAIIFCISKNKLMEYKKNEVIAAF
jgi:diaminobutyrate-2-oxoglutarate transaminase